MASKEAEREGLGSFYLKDQSGRYSGIQWEKKKSFLKDIFPVHIVGYCRYSLYFKLLCLCLGGINNTNNRALSGDIQTLGLNEFDTPCLKSVTENFGFSFFPDTQKKGKN